jgi:hypothetical protein
MSKVKNLSVAAIQKEHAKEFNVRKEVHLDGYVLTVDKVFRPTKITAMLREMVEQITDLRQKGANIDDFDFTTYGMLLTIKHFSSVDIPKTIEKQLQVLEAMIDKEYLLPIVESFEQTEMAKIHQAVANLSENIGTLLEKAKELELKNEDILELIGKENPDTE